MPTFRPERSLLHPVWIASLVLLALNDHVFKGSGLLPDWITGKLSDCSGLMVAPLVLAVLVRARRPSAFFVCHAAVGVVFALFEISPAAARAVESVLPVRMWPDLTDLAALVVLPISYRLFSARASGDVEPRVLHAVAGVLGLVFCTATSYVPPAFPESGSAFENPIYLHNGSAGVLYVSVSAAPAPTPADCARLQFDADYARELDLETVGAWTLGSGRNMPLVLGEVSGSACVVVTVNNHVVLFSPRDLPVLRVPFAGRAPSAGEVHWDGQRFSASPSVFVGSMY